MLRAAAIACALIATPGVTAAEPVLAAPTPTVVWSTPAGPGVLDIEARHAEVAPTIYLNRCLGNCSFTKGIDDASSQQSSIPQGTGPFVITEFRHGDAVWDQVVACVRETFAPYGAIITDVRPPPGTQYHASVVAGSPAEIGMGQGVGGVGVGTCDPVNNVTSFTFANRYPPNAVLICSVIAQEAGHSWGLDHAFACSDPMTYLGACGQQFFRHKQFRCGEYAARDCNCSGPYQDSHLRLLSVFGPGQPIAAPVVTLQVPQPAAQVTPGFPVFGRGVAKRGFGHYELWLNGYRWGRENGPVGVEDQVFSFQTTTAVPDGIIDVELRVYDDLDQGYGAAAATVTKGAPCTTAATCAAGQRCDAGRCLWDPPTGELGDACTYPQFCTTGTCEDGLCTKECFAGISGECPAQFECEVATGDRGFCVAADGGGSPGICSARGDADAGPLVVQLGLVGIVLAGVGRRRRRRR